MTTRRGLSSGTRSNPSQKGERARKSERVDKRKLLVSFCLGLYQVQVSLGYRDRAYKGHSALCADDGKKGDRREKSDVHSILKTFPIRAHCTNHHFLLSHLQYVCGHKGRITLEKQWSRTRQAFALHTTRKDILVHDPSFTQYRTLGELFPPNSTCFMLGHPNYGCQGEVVQVGGGNVTRVFMPCTMGHVCLKVSAAHRGRVQLRFLEDPEPDLRSVIRARGDLSNRYMPGFRLAQALGISSHVLSRITGSIFINKSPKATDPDRQARVNVGLNLKVRDQRQATSSFLVFLRGSRCMNSSSTSATRKFADTPNEAMTTAGCTPKR